MNAATKIYNLYVADTAPLRVNLGDEIEKTVKLVRTLRERGAFWYLFTDVTADEHVRVQPQLQQRLHRWRFSSFLVPRTLCVFVCVSEFEVH